jgi:hypothetical protein
MDLLHQSLKRAPAYFAKILVNVRHDLLAVTGAVHGHSSPAKIIVGLAKAAIADVRCFGCHTSD